MSIVKHKVALLGSTALRSISGRAGSPIVTELKARAKIAGIRAIQSIAHLIQEPSMLNATLRCRPTCLDARTEADTAKRFKSVAKLSVTPWVTSVAKHQ